MIKKWNWILFFMTIVLCIVIFYINYKYYAGVIGMGFFSQLIGLSLFYSVYGLFKKEKCRRINFVNGGIITLIIIMFVIAIPDYTYKESRQIVASDYLGQKNTDTVDMPILDKKTVPTNSSSSWFLYDQLYYVGIKDDQQNQMLYYAVDPIQGRILKLDQPFW